MDWLDVVEPGEGAAVADSSWKKAAKEEHEQFDGFDGQIFGERFVLHSQGQHQ